MFGDGRQDDGVAASLPLFLQKGCHFWENLYFCKNRLLCRK